MLYSLKYFKTSQDARNHRRDNGTGGWIFEPSDGAASILFPPEFTPSMIFHHNATKNRDGKLIGSQ